MEWAWNRVVSIKQTIDRDTLPLFDEEISELPDSAKQNLVSQSRQLEHLKVLITEGIKLTRALTIFSVPSNGEELELKLRIASLIKFYVEAILWFFNVGLLPERENLNVENAFPSSELSRAYSAKRNKFRSKVSEWLDTNKQIGVDSQRPSLLIDSICKHIGDQLKVIYIEMQMYFPIRTYIHMSNLALICRSTLKKKAEMVIILLLLCTRS